MPDVIESGTLRLEIVEPGPELLEMLATYTPRGPLAPLHYHPEQEEQFVVRSGALDFRVDGNDHVLRPGDELVVPPGAVHQAQNRGDQPAVVTWQVRPALETAAMFRAIFGAIRDGKPPPFLTRVLIGQRYGREMVLAGPPRAVQTCVFALLAPLARALGHRI